MRAGKGTIHFFLEIRRCGACTRVIAEAAVINFAIDWCAICPWKSAIIGVLHEWIFVVNMDYRDRMVARNQSNS